MLVTQGAAVSSLQQHGMQGGLLYKVMQGSHLEHWWVTANLAKTGACMHDTEQAQLNKRVTSMLHNGGGYCCLQYYSMWPKPKGSIITYTLRSAPGNARTYLAKCAASLKLDSQCHLLVSFSSTGLCNPSTRRSMPSMPQGGPVSQQSKEVVASCKGKGVAGAFFVADFTPQPPA